MSAVDLCEGCCMLMVLIGRLPVLTMLLGTCVGCEMLAFQRRAGR